MRTSQEIEDRIRFLLVQELDARVAKAGLRLPRTCVHNYRHNLDVRKNVDGSHNDNYNRITKGPSLPVVQTIGLCLLLDVNGNPLQKSDPENWGGTICEDPIDAQRCQYFTPIVTRESLLQQFTEQLKDEGWIQNNMLEVHALLWAAQNTHTPNIPWWKRVLYWFLRINVEPLQPVEDPGKLLGP